MKRATRLFLDVLIVCMIFIGTYYASNLFYNEGFEIGLQSGFEQGYSIAMFFACREV